MILNLMGIMMAFTSLYYVLRSSKLNKMKCRYVNVIGIIAS
jgi:hypothetical protein